MRKNNRPRGAGVNKGSASSQVVKKGETFEQVLYRYLYASLEGVPLPCMEIAKKELERDLVNAALYEAGQNVTKAASLLRMKRTTLAEKLRVMANTPDGLGGSPAQYRRRRFFHKYKNQSQE